MTLCPVCFGEASQCQCPREAVVAHFTSQLTTARAQLAVLAADVTAAWEYIDGYETTGHDYAETHGTKLRYAACQRAHEKTLSDPALAALVEGGG